ncbi:MAG: FAD-binding oxidoreductase, partial [Pseudomonadota bacterium]
TPPGPVDPPLNGDCHADVAIIGAGYTGLSAGLHLARDHGLAPVVLDAQEVGWGASGRNGGFNCMGGTKLSDRAYASRYGDDDLAALYRAMVDATRLVEELSEGADIGAQSPGEWCLAHRASDAAGFRDAAAQLKRFTGLQAQVLPGDALAEHGLGATGMHGAMFTPAGFALNPRAYVMALARAARGAGVTIHGQTPVIGAEPGSDGRPVLTTPQGRITADRVILAANGYSSEDIPSAMAGRYLPVISHIIVTEPLPQDGPWRGTNMAYDSRALLHYFRRLPDGRMLFGQRGEPNDGAHRRKPMAKAAQRDFAAMFPEWASARIDYHWAGLVCMTAARTPYVGPIPGFPGCFASLAYHGNGVSMGTWCGRQVAGLAVGRPPGGLPKGFQGPLRPFPLPRLRRHFLRAAFQWYAWKDR